MVQKFGEVAYELELPEGSKIRNVFHISCPKKVTGKHISVSETLPPLDDEGQLILIQEIIVKTRERNPRSGTVRNTWYNGRIFLVKKPLGKMKKKFSTETLHCLRTSNLGWGGLSFPIPMTLLVSNVSPTY